MMKKFYEKYFIDWFVKMFLVVYVNVEIIWFGEKILLRVFLKKILYIFWKRLFFGFKGVMIKGIGYY